MRRLQMISKQRGHAICLLFEPFCGDCLLVNFDCARCRSATENQRVKWVFHSFITQTLSCLFTFPALSLSDLWVASSRVGVWKRISKSTREGACTENWTQLIWKHKNKTRQLIFFFLPLRFITGFCSRLNVTLLSLAANIKKFRLSRG